MLKNSWFTRSYAATITLNSITSLLYYRIVYDRCSSWRWEKTDSVPRSRVFTVPLCAQKIAGDIVRCREKNHCYSSLSAIYFILFIIHFIHLYADNDDCVRMRYARVHIYVHTYVCVYYATRNNNIIIVLRPRVGGGGGGGGVLDLSARASP